MRILIFLGLMSILSIAKVDLYPKTECGLFNNLKHTQNRDNEVLKLDRTYEMLKHHKGQYLLKVEYATPSQRWVDDDCLTLRPLRSSPLYNNNNIKKVSIDEELENANTKLVKKSSATQNLLALSWHNAFCETHRYKKECKRDLSSLLGSRSKEKEFVLHGLWPQPRTNTYCNVDNELKNVDKNKRWKDLPCLLLDDDVETNLEKVMPGFASDLHKHEWIKHGTCYGTDANTYYKDAIGLVEQVNNSALGKYFTQNVGKVVTLLKVQNLTNQAFGKGAGKRVELRCKNGLITELWLHLGSGSNDMNTLLQRGKKVNGRCHKGRIDKAGFGR